MEIKLFMINLTSGQISVVLITGFLFVIGVIKAIFNYIENKQEEQRIQKIQETEL